MTQSNARRQRRIEKRGTADATKEACTYEQAAETTRQMVGAAVLQAGQILDGCEIDQREAVRALAEGALAAAVDAFLRFNVAIGLPLKEVRTELVASVLTYYRQSLATHLEEKRKREQDAASPPTAAFEPGEAPQTIPPVFAAHVPTPEESPDAPEPEA